MRRVQNLGHVPSELGHLRSHQEPTGKVSGGLGSSLRSSNAVSAIWLPSLAGTCPTAPPHASLSLTPRYTFGSVAAFVPALRSDEGR